MNFNKKEIDVIARASAILEERAQQYKAIAFTGPNAVADYLYLRVGGLEHEVFGVLWLDAQNRLIEADELFRGTLTQISVYPREVVNTALARNAGAAVLYHNHPSGSAEPSRADELLTGTLRTALALVDVRVIDHVVVTAGKTMSFAERGLI